MLNLLLLESNKRNSSNVKDMIKFFLNGRELGLFWSTRVLLVVRAFPLATGLRFPEGDNLRLSRQPKSRRSDEIERKGVF